MDGCTVRTCNVPYATSKKKKYHHTTRVRHGRYTSYAGGTAPTPRTKPCTTQVFLPHRARTVCTATYCRPHAKDETREPVGRTSDLTSTWLSLCLFPSPHSIDFARQNGQASGSLRRGDHRHPSNPSPGYVATWLLFDCARFFIPLLFLSDRYLHTDSDTSVLLLVTLPLTTLLLSITSSRSLCCTNGTSRRGTLFCLFLSFSAVHVFAGCALLALCCVGRVSALFCACALVLVGSSCSTTFISACCLISRAVLPRLWRPDEDRTGDGEKYTEASNYAECSSATLFLQSLPLNCALQQLADSVSLPDELGVCPEAALANYAVSHLALLVAGWAVVTARCLAVIVAFGC